MGLLPKLPPRARRFRRGGRDGDRSRRRGGEALKARRVAEILCVAVAGVGFDGGVLECREPLHRCSRGAVGRRIEELGESDPNGGISPGRGHPERLGHGVARDAHDEPVVNDGDQSSAHVRAGEFRMFFPDVIKAVEELFQVNLHGWERTRRSMTKRAANAFIPTVPQFLRASFTVPAGGDWRGSAGPFMRGQPGCLGACAGDWRRGTRRSRGS